MYIDDFTSKQPLYALLVILINMKKNKDNFAWS